MADSVQIADHDQAGFSVTELIVVMVIIGVVCAFAVLHRGAANEQLTRQNVAQQLKVAFERARFDSVKRRAQDSPDVRAKVVVKAGSYALTTYPINASGTPTLNTLTTTTSGQNVVLAGNNSITLPYTVYFNQRGEAFDKDGFSASPSFLVCNASCSSPTAANANLVIVTPTGTINLLPGGSTVPTFTTPNVTTVPPGTGVSNITTVPSP